MRKKYPLHIHISTAFVLTLLLVSSLITTVGYLLAREILQSSAKSLNQRVVQQTVSFVDSIVNPAEMACSLISSSSISENTGLADRLRNLHLLSTALKASSSINAVYVGYDNGDFFFIRALPTPQARQKFSAPNRASYLVESIEHEGVAPEGRYIFFDQSLKLLRTEQKSDYAAKFDPRTREWYRQAMVSGEMVRTEPYVFYSDHKIGTTFSVRASNRHAVVGVDISLESLSQRLATQKGTPNTHLALLDSDGLVVAYPEFAKILSSADNDVATPELKWPEQLGVPVFAKLIGQIGRLTPSTRFDGVIEAGDNWLVSVTPLPMKNVRPMQLITAIPDHELFADAFRLASDSMISALVIIALSLPLVWWAARAISRSLRTLMVEADAVRRFDFSHAAVAGSMILEVHELAVTMDKMRQTIQRFLAISESVAAERDFTRLLPKLLEETLGAVDADSGVLYLIDDDGLIPVAVGKNGNDCREMMLLPVPLDSAGPLVSGVCATKQTRSVILSHEDIVALDIAMLLDGEDGHYGIAVPLLNREQQLIGIILLVRHAPIAETEIAFIKALANSSASSLEMRELIKAQRDLFEAFIKLIASSIDAKSPYTGGHCARVPELIKMLAGAACDQTEGPFGDFSLSDDDWEAVHVAGWLHDCGKVTTPEYVIDKATKLETIYDRIHEIRMRFEVLKRDAEIVHLKAIAAGDDSDQAATRLAAALRQLDDDFAFVATCNEGGEFMAPDKMERLRRIAAITWWRTLDDHIGISHEEKTRKRQTAGTPLPVQEQLIADKPEHRFDRRPADRIEPDNPWGFRMRVPELLYNRGELYNLMISRGTLSDEERYKINEHIVQTVIMLSQLPFPRHLRGVPEIACGHHEKVDGTGYPKGLKKEEMTPLARMMVIADIFEALTATDRPYKKGKTLSETIRIMAMMTRDHHIDPELFELFLKSGVYRNYAVRFLRPEQVDEVDIEQYLSIVI